MIIVGSTALKYFSLNRLEPKDIDRWFYQSEEVPDLKGDDHTVPKSIYDLIPIVNNYATPDAIYTIKCSHFAWDIKWDKTKVDIIWLKAKGCKLIPKLYNVLKHYWKEMKGYKEFLDFNKSKEDFFNDFVTYIYDHDYLHTLVSYPDEPMYKKILKNNEEVLIDDIKFDILSFDDKIREIKEEIVVIAVERWLTNPCWKGKTSWYEAYIKSLKKTILFLTRDVQEEFIIQNLEYFIKPDYSYFEYILNKLELRMKVDTYEIEEFLKVLHPDNELDDETIVALADGDLYDIEINYPDEHDHWGYRRDYLSAKTKELGYEHVVQEGGGEGGTEYCYGVFKLKDKLYKVEWSYYSHQGYYRDGALETLKEVKPKEKTIILYE